MKQVTVENVKLNNLVCDCIVAVAKVFITGVLFLDEKFIKETNKQTLADFKALEYFDDAKVKSVKSTLSHIKEFFYVVKPRSEELDKKTKEEIKKRYCNILDLAKRRKFNKIALPTILIGSKVKNFVECIQVAIDSVSAWIKTNKSDINIIFYVESNEDLLRHQMFYPFCSWDSDEKFQNIVMDIIEAIGDVKALDTREKAMTAAREMYRRAIELDNQKVVQVYRRLLYEFETATDDEYKLLYNQCHSNKLPKQVEMESSEIVAIRKTFEKGISLISKESISILLDVKYDEANKILENLLEMEYIEKHIEQNDMIIYKISITKAEFFNLHGE